MTRPLTAPKGYQRREDGLLEPINGFIGHRGKPQEAVLTWWAGKRLLGCIQDVHKGGGMGFHMCGNRAKHDPDHNGNPTKCGTHSAAAVARRKQKQRERDAAERAKWARRSALMTLSQEAPEIIQKIADGHNDPRGLCQDWLDRRAKVRET